ncbi:similar to phytoene dehydrogenase [hydrothermal vent metagenome]|uniref:Similar to phytoene dehydrogenase n=1 Tax=hydrothermal vent metagenome TaxID=652676 RepID=A0A3B1CD35_9ZZZZ
MAALKLNNLKSEYDCIVIGAGLGGLTCANRLAKAGHSVLLLEHHFQLGGLAAWFKRKEHIFDVALHGFPVGMIKTCRKYWSQEIASHIVQLKGIRFDNPQFSFTTTYDKESFTSILNEKFDVEFSTIEKFFKTTRDMSFVDDESMTTRELFDQFFPGRDDVVRLLMEPITYANGSTLDDPAVSYSIVFSNFMNKGVYTFTGGTDLIIRMMESELVKNGVDIRTRAMVEKIIVKDGHTCGVVVNGQEVKSKSVVSNGNLKSTILRMLDRDAVSKEFRAKTDAVRVNNSSCQVYLGIKRGEEVDYIGDLLFTSTADKFDTDLLLGKDVTSRTFSVYYPDTRPKHKRMAIVASTNARFEDWADLTDEEYQHDKDHLAQTTLDALEKYIPGVRRKIDHVEVSTPRTFKRYTLHVGGSSFGTKFEGLKISQGISEQVHGLYHTGSVAIIMSGWLGAANYGVIVANEADRYIRSLAD